MQQDFIQGLITAGTVVNIYLRNGVKLTGIILAQDASTLLFDGARSESLVFKDGISTIAKNKLIES